MVENVHGRRMENRLVMAYIMGTSLYVLEKKAVENGISCIQKHQPRRVLLYQDVDRTQKIIQIFIFVNPKSICEYKRTKLFRT